ncbi:MAG: GAF domain-containing protein [candidate division KSB1 bacterium]|nr:GAF domain-containing protein [candidate division KSB1 bacterium]
MNQDRGKDRAAALHALVDAVARGDLVEVGQLARQAAESALNCHQAVILRYDPERQWFVTTSILNQGTRYAYPETTVPLAECSWKEVLATHAMLTVRATEVHSPSERTLLGDRDVVAFVFPVHWGTESLGVIYATSEQEREPEEYERAAVEEVATLVALALERARISAIAAEAEQASRQWRQRYTHLFAHVEQPVMVADLAADLVYEANPAMAQLLGYAEEELHAMRLSALFWAGEMPDWRTLLAHGSASTSCRLRLSSGEPKQVRIEAASLGDRGEGRCLLIAHTGGEAAAREEPAPALPEMANLISALDESGEIEASVQSLFDWLGSALGAAFGTLHVVPAQGQELETKIMRSFASKQELSPNVASALAQGPYHRVLELGTVVECPSVAASGDFAELRPVAERAGYDAFLAAPLTVAQRRVGVLTCFFPHARSFATEHKELFALGARLLGFLVTWAEHQRRLERMASGAQTVLDIVAGLPALRSAEKIATHVAGRLQGKIPFDLFSITLFEQEGAQARALCLASPALSELVAQMYRWEAVADSELGWLRPYPEFEGSRAQLALADRLGSRISVLLLARGAYIGNLSLGALGEEAFSREDVGLLRMLAPSVAEALAASGEQSGAAPQQDARSQPEQEILGTPGQTPPEKSFDPVAIGAELRLAIEELEQHLGLRGSGDEPLAAQWQTVRKGVERLLSALEGPGDKQGARGDEEVPQPVSVSRLINEVTVELHRAGRLRGVQLMVIPGPALEIMTRPRLMARALKELLEATLAMAASTHQPRVEVGYREQLLNKFIYLRYSGPVLDLSGTRAGEERWRAASERAQAAQHLVMQCGGKLTARPLSTGEAELLISFAKAAAVGDG